LHNLSGWVAQPAGAIWQVNYLILSWWIELFAIAIRRLAFFMLRCLPGLRTLESCGRLKILG
jgi:hypothetical protein